MRKVGATALALIFAVPVLGLCEDKTDQPNTAAGHKLFVQHCSECHGREAEGTTRAPSLAAIAKSLDSPQLESLIKNGNLRRGMPSWSRLPEQRRRQIAMYLRSLNRSF